MTHRLRMRGANTVLTGSGYESVGSVWITGQGQSAVTKSNTGAKVDESDNTLYTLSWNVELTVPSAGIPDGLTFTDYVASSSRSGIHYITSAQAIDVIDALEKAWGEGNITNIQFCTNSNYWSNSDGDWVDAADINSSSDTVYYQFRFTTAYNVEYYDSATMESTLSTGEQTSLSNYGYFTRIEDKDGQSVTTVYYGDNTISYSYSSTSNVDGYETNTYYNYFTDSYSTKSSSWTWYEKVVKYGVTVSDTAAGTDSNKITLTDPDDYTVSWIVRVVVDSSDTYTITDTLPAGVTLEKLYVSKSGSNYGYEELTVAESYGTEETTSISGIGTFDCTVSQNTNDSDSDLSDDVYTVNLTASGLADGVTLIYIKYVCSAENVTVALTETTDDYTKTTYENMTNTVVVTTGEDTPYGNAEETTTLVEKIATEDTAELVKEAEFDSNNNVLNYSVLINKVDGVNYYFYFGSSISTTGSDCNGYDSETMGNAKNVIVSYTNYITNAHSSDYYADKTTLSVTKTWLDADNESYTKTDGSLTFDLYRVLILNDGTITSVEEVEGTKNTDDESETESETETETETESEDTSGKAMLTWKIQDTGGVSSSGSLTVEASAENPVTLQLSFYSGGLAYYSDWWWYPQVILYKGSSASGDVLATFSESGWEDEFTTYNSALVTDGWVDYTDYTYNFTIVLTEDLELYCDTGDCTNSYASISEVDSWARLVGDDSTDTDTESTEGDMGSGTGSTEGGTETTTESTEAAAYNEGTIYSVNFSALYSSDGSYYTDDSGGTTDYLLEEVPLGTADGDSQTKFFTVMGNLNNTYNPVTWNVNGAAATLDVCLKMGSKASITFTTEESGTLFLVMTNPKNSKKVGIVLDGTEVLATATNYTNSQLASEYLDTEMGETLGYFVYFVVEESIYDENGEKDEDGNYPLAFITTYLNNSGITGGSIGIANQINAEASGSTSIAVVKEWLYDETAKSVLSDTALAKLQAAIDNAEITYEVYAMMNLESGMALTAGDSYECWFNTTAGTEFFEVGSGASTTPNGGDITYGSTTTGTALKMNSSGIVSFDAPAADGTLTLVFSALNKTASSSSVSTTYYGPDFQITDENGKTYTYLYDAATGAITDKNGKSISNDPCSVKCVTYDTTKNIAVFTLELESAGVYTISRAKSTECYLYYMKYEYQYCNLVDGILTKTGTLTASSAITTTTTTTTEVEGKVKTTTTTTAIKDSWARLYEGLPLYIYDDDGKTVIGTYSYYVKETGVNMSVEVDGVEYTIEEDDSGGYLLRFRIVEDDGDTYEYKCSISADVLMSYVDTDDLLTELVADASTQSEAATEEEAATEDASESTAEESSEEASESAAEEVSEEISETAAEETQDTITIADGTVTSGIAEITNTVVKVTRTNTSVILPATGGLGRHGFYAIAAILMGVCATALLTHLHLESVRARKRRRR